MDDFPEIPGCKILSVHGGGGAAKVYLGIQENLDRKVAIKVLHPHLLKNKENAERFKKGAKAAANLSHSSIVKIFNIGKAGNYHYIVMEYLEDSLKERLECIKGRKMPPESALSIVEKIMQALDYAHLRGVYHRDLKPDNIMFKHDGTPVIVDFGIARVYESTDELTWSGTRIFTVFYYSPEQCRSKQVDGRSDIYSLGVILYEMLTGEKPYKGESVISVMLQHIEGPVPILPMELSLYQPLIDKMMAKDKEKRIVSYPEFVQLLEEIRQSFHPLYSIIRLIDISNLKKDYLQSGKIIMMNLNKGKILEKKPLFTLGRDLRYYWVSTGNKAENKAKCVIKDQLKDQQVIVKIWYKVECKPQEEEKIVLALSRKNKPDEALNEFIENWFQDFAAQKRKEGINPILGYYDYSDELGNYLYKKAEEEVGLFMQCSLSLKYEDELKEYKIDSKNFPVRVKDFADELSLKFSTGLSVHENNKIFAILNYPYLNDLEPLVRKHIRKRIKKDITYHDFVTGLNSSVKKKITRSLNKLLEKKGRKVAWIKLKSDFDSEIHPYNEEARILIEKEKYEEALLIIVKAESQNFADDVNRALKEKVIKELSDDEEQSFKKPTKQGKSINYPEAGSTRGRDEMIGSVIKILDKTPIITIYGIPGIGKSVFIHEIRKSESHINRLYKRFVVKHDMTVNDLFQKLALLLGCRDMLNHPDFDLSKKSDFSFLETKAQYRVASLIHLDDAQHLFLENQFRDNAVKEFLVAVTQYYPDTRIILECRIVPPAGIFPEELHQSIRLHGIDKGSMILYFKQPFKNNPGFGWQFGKVEQELALRELCSKGKGNIHPLAMVLLSNRAYQLNKKPTQIIKDPESMKELIDESGDLILIDLNQTTLQAAGPNMSLNIKMYNEDIPAYLYESLQERIRKLTGDAETEDLLAAGTIADKWENELRIAVSEKLYGEGKKHLQEIIKLDKERKERLKEELGYIYDFDNLETDENQWAQKQGEIEWRRKVWQVLSRRNNFELHNLDTIESHEDILEKKIERENELKKPKKKVEKDKSTPVEKGEELERAVLKLFKDFFYLWEEENIITLTNARQQGKGLQFGHDLKFVCGGVGDKDIRVLIECKNYSGKIATKDIADKLIQVDEYYEQGHIDHWILISPNEDVSSELENFIERWEKSGKFSFKVQAWTPATRVKEFFGLDPDIYDNIIKVPDLEIHPKDWSEEKRQEVIEFWKQKLDPPLRLPVGWEDYLRQPGKLRLEPKEIEFEKRCNNNDYVELNCKDETGAELAQTLEEKIYDWLEEPGYSTLFLLGEFGDGKTFFTYVLTRKLVEKFRESPEKGWLPVRFALKNFSRSFDPDKPKNIQDFLQHRLNELRTDIAGWNELRSSGYKILVILDGFDEISKELDPETIQRNIDILINFYENDYFSDLKILITSRKHFFENHKEKEWLIDKLDKPQLLHLAPIDRKITEDYLRKYAAGIGREEKFNKLKDFHDPIGLASKPLFLDMVQVSLENLPEEDLNEYTLYETYILESLKRKENFLHDKRKETPKHKIIENLLKGLELVAQELHRSRKEFVYLSEIKGKKDLKEWLWTLSEPDEKTTVDETGRIAARSLLKRFNVTDQPKGKTWPVDFCHRSMREYFVARVVCNLLENDPEEAETFLINCFLTHEILFFAGEIMKHRVFDYESRLLDLIRKTKNVEKIDRIKLGYLGGNTVNLLYQYKGKLPGNDWKNLVLEGAILPGADLSGKDFSGTSLQYANLDNVNCNDSNFTNCNLTEVRIEETTPVQSIAVSPGEKILSLYYDGIIREWSYQRLHGATSTNLTGNKAEKDMKLMALPGNDLTVLHDRFLYFYDRNDLHLDLKAAIEIKPNFRLVKATRDYLLLNEEDGKQNRLLLVDLNKEAIVKSYICPPFTLCDHFDDCALVFFNQNDELQLIDITLGKRTPLNIPTGQKVACISTCKCGQLPGQYLLGLGLYNGAVQVWQIQVNQWKSEKILDQLLHQQGKPVKDICFIDECRIVTGGLDKTIKLLTFNPDGEPVGDPKEFKMTLQCQGMKIDGVIRDKERKRLQELIDKATK